MKDNLSAFIQNKISKCDTQTSFQGKKKMA